MSENIMTPVECKSTPHLFQRELPSTATEQLRSASAMKEVRHPSGVQIKEKFAYTCGSKIK